MIIILVHSLSRVILQNVKDKKVFINLRADILNNYRLFTAYLGNWRLVDFLILFLVWRLMAAVSASPQSLGQKVPLSGVRGPGCSLASSSSSSSSSLEHHGPFGITIPEDVQSYKVARYFVRAAREKTVPSSSSASTGSTSSGLSEEIERRSALSVLARAPSRLEKLCWEPTGFFTTLISLVELTFGGGGGGGGRGAWTPVCAPDEAREA